MEGAWSGEKAFTNQPEIALIVRCKSIGFTSYGSFRQ